MPLRLPNNPTVDSNILNVLKTVLPNDPTTGQPNTVIGQNQVVAGTSLIYIQNKYQMSLGNFPAVHLGSGTQAYHRNSNRTYTGLYEVFVEYYNRWDQQPNTIDGIRAGIAADLERMKANIEDNDSLDWQGQANVISAPEMMLSSYKGEFDTQFPGLTLVYRTLILHFNILPYDTL